MTELKRAYPTTLSEDRSVRWLKKAPAFPADPAPISKRHCPCRVERNYGGSGHYAFRTASYDQEQFRQRTHGLSECGSSGNRTRLTGRCHEPASDRPRNGRERIRPNCPLSLSATQRNERAPGRPNRRPAGPARRRTASNRGPKGGRFFVSTERSGPRTPRNSAHAKSEEDDSWSAPTGSSAPDERLNPRPEGGNAPFPVGRMGKSALDLVKSLLKMEVF